MTHPTISSLFTPHALRLTPHEFGERNWRIVLCLTIVFCACCLLTPTWSLGFTDRIVAIVNKEVITLSDLQQEIQDEHSRQGQISREGIRTALYTKTTRSAQCVNR